MRGDWVAFGEGMRQATDAAWAQIANIVNYAKDNLLAIIGSLITSIVSLWNNTDWGAIGRGIIDGIASSLTGGSGRIAEAARDAARAALDAAKGFLGISSPSKLAAEMIGAPFSEGVALGITRGIGRVQMASAHMAGAAVSSGGAVIDQSRHYTYQIAANYANQPERELIDDVRLYSMLTG
jgi:phage-related protein